MSLHLSRIIPIHLIPTTTINYSIPEAGNVELKVYDVLGNEVANLVNQEMAPGNYTACLMLHHCKWNLHLHFKNWYFCSNKKMILMK